MFDAVQATFDNEEFFSPDYQVNDVRIGHTYFLRDRNEGYKEAAIEHFVFQVIPIMREYLKDGIFDLSLMDMPRLEKTAVEIKGLATREEQVASLATNIMLFVKHFGQQNQHGLQINNNYIGGFIDGLISQYNY